MLNFAFIRFTLNDTNAALAWGHGTTETDGRSRRVYNLYYSPGACSLAPHVLLEEIGEPYDLELVSVAHGETQTPEYRAINPKGRVPTLRMVAGRGGGAEGVLTEAPAILAYLARTHPEGGLWPSDAAGEARPGVDELAGQQ